MNDVNVIEQARLDFLKNNPSWQHKGIPIEWTTGSCGDPGCCDPWMECQFCGATVGGYNDDPSKGHEPGCLWFSDGELRDENKWLRESIERLEKMVHQQAKLTREQDQNMRDYLAQVALTKRNRLAAEAEIAELTEKLRLAQNELKALRNGSASTNAFSAILEPPSTTGLKRTIELQRDRMAVLESKLTSAYADGRASGLAYIREVIDGKRNG